MRERIVMQNWALFSLSQNPYQAPEVMGQALGGEVYGHPRHKDGKRVITSRIIEKGNGIVKTLNTTYILGDVDPEYLAAFPTSEDFLK